jgi:hypothetical protein
MIVPPGHRGHRKGTVRRGRQGRQGHSRWCQCGFAKEERCHLLWRRPAVRSKVLLVLRALRRIRRSHVRPDVKLAGDGTERVRATLHAGFARDAASQNEAVDELLAEERSLVADSSQVSAENLRGIQRREFMHVHERDFLCGTVGAIGGEALSHFSSCLAA